jgi:biopolymer transport protein ExbD
MRRRPQRKPPGLMLTSLLDMFTIILIFLIVSFEAEDYDFKLNSDLTLPTSSARSVLKPAVDIAITPTDLVVDKKSVAKLTNGKFPASNYRNQEIPELVEVLKKRYALVKDEAVNPETGEDNAIIVVQADKSLDYDTVYLVLRSSALSGFVKYRLAIMKK